MYSLSNSSKQRLDTCDTRLQTIILELLEILDVSVLCGHRTEEEQNEAYNTNKSKLRYPDSKHNSTPSSAIDVAPFINGGIPWNEPEYFYFMAGHIMAIAHKHGVKLRWGGDWNRNNSFKDNSFNDLPHFEIYE